MSLGYVVPGVFGVRGHPNLKKPAFKKTQASLATGGLSLCQMLKSLRDPADGIMGESREDLAGIIIPIQVCCKSPK